MVTERRQPILTDPAVRQALREAIVSVRRTLPFKIKGWVLLPDHLHAIWTLPDGDSDYSNRWRLIKRQVARACGADSSEAYIRLIGPVRSARPSPMSNKRRAGDPASVAGSN